MALHQITSRTEERYNDRELGLSLEGILLTSPCHEFEILAILEHALHECLLLELCSVG